MKKRAKLLKSKPPPIISTFDEGRLRKEDLLDVSGRWRGQFLLESQRSKKEGDVQLLPRFCHINGDLLRFPSQTRGFLYYHTPPTLPATAGGLRFCLVEEPADVLAHKGTRDLLLPNGLPWQIPLLSIVREAHFEHLFRQLQVDGLVSRDLIAQCQKVPDFYRYKWTSPVLFGLGEPFGIRCDSVFQFNQLFDPVSATLVRLKIPVNDLVSDDLVSKYMRDVYRRTDETKRGLRECPRFTFTSHPY